MRPKPFCFAIFVFVSISWVWTAEAKKTQRSPHRRVRVAREERGSETETGIEKEAL